MLNEDTSFTYETPPDPEEMQRLRHRYSHRGGAIELAVATGMPESTVRGFLTGTTPKVESWHRLHLALASFDDAYGLT